MTKKGTPQPCYLRIGNDTPEEASFCETINEAKEQYGRAARQLANFGQEIGASLHFVDAQGDDFDEYPDRILRLSRSGLVVMEDT